MATGIRSALRGHRALIDLVGHQDPEEQCSQFLPVYHRVQGTHMEQVAGADIQDLGDKKDLAALGTHMVLPRPGIPTDLTLGTILGAPERDRITLMAPGTTTEIA